MVREASVRRDGAPVDAALDLPRDARGSSSGLGLGFLQRILPRLAGRLLEGRDPLSRALDATRLRLMQAELAEAHGKVVHHQGVDWDTLVPPARQDWVLVGDRGSGKTAMAVRLGQDLSRALGQPLLLPDVPDEVCYALEGERTDLRAALKAQDAVIVVDESYLRIPTGKRNRFLYEALALGRQRGTSLIWTSQGLTGVHVDVLRQGAALGFKYLDPVAARFDREELADLVASVTTIQGSDVRFQDPASVLVYASGFWGSCTSVPLPTGWTERVSRLWR